MFILYTLNLRSFKKSLIKGFCDKPYLRFSTLIQGS